MFKANFESISTAGADIVNGANKIEQQLNDMDTQLRPLQSDWTGAASDAYEQARATWTQTINEMKQLLAEIGAAVTQSGQDYQTTDSQNANRFA
ncbi:MULTISPECIES: WXG100 family type VII secretion target [unclassified Pseudactinotalea]|uniref:WXG100 family type VII secretion target n=1 Tax=Micrococcales TaxID=85006 RepID=UPI003C79C026